MCCTGFRPVQNEPGQVGNLSYEAMITPERAAVRPRVKRKGDDTAYLLEEEIAELAHAGRRGVVVLGGPPGSGKTTAIRHLAAVLPSADTVRLHDPDPYDGRSYGGVGPIFLGNHMLEVYTKPIASATPILDLELAPWSQDEWIEYLLARHPDRCKSVMARLLADEQSRSAVFTAEIWRVILDEMAADETVASPLDAMICRLSKRFTHEQQLALSPSALDEMRRAQVIPWSEAVKVVPDIDRPSWRLLNQPQVIFWIAAAYAVRVLKLNLPHEDARCLENISALPRGYLYNLADILRGDSPATSQIFRIARSANTGCHAAAVTVLHLAGALPTPADGAHPDCGSSLAGAILEGVRWPGVSLKGMFLRSADFSSANLSHSCLDNVLAEGVDLSQADLRHSSLRVANLVSANLVGANLSRTTAPSAKFAGADCRNAIFDDADLYDTVWLNANLVGASFHRTNLSQAGLRHTTIDGADFTAANLSRARLDGLNLAAAEFRHAIFTDAMLVGCNLDGVDLPKADCEGANFTNATFTGASMPGANLRDASLRGSGLADVDWEGADLRYADLRGAVFSMGGSRSGLVGSPYPGHGTRTGFYTDDFNDLATHKHPEEIRKANLCGVDLRGANIEGVDFYLVDLRGARYDAEQAEQLLRCGAILKEPVA